MTVTFDSAAAQRRFRAGVSLHSHTLHSRETLAVLYQLAEQSVCVRAGVRVIEREFLRATGQRIDLNRGWWTPPLAPLQAWRLERSHIEAKGLVPIVSITDHDNIDAPLSLRVLDECRPVPISVEWSVPFEKTFFHLGLHNMPHSEARALMERFERYTATCTGNIHELLGAVAQNPDSLVVLNHPFWDEAGIGPTAHEHILRRFVLRYRRFIHCLELNGLRAWHENKRVLAFAQTVDRPVVSGGDRHGTEPNAVLNLTHATTFGDFAEEIRSGTSNILMTERYRESHAWRILHNFEVMAGEMEHHAHGWRHWSDRVFYQGENGDVESFKSIFGGRVPRALNAPLRLLRLVSVPGIRRAIRAVGPRPYPLTAVE